MSSNGFTVSAESAASANVLSDRIQDDAIAMTRDMIEVGGMSPSIAGSLVANMLIRAAWIVASQGRLAEKQEPRPEQFAIVAREWADRLVFESKFDVRYCDARQSETDETA